MVHYSIDTNIRAQTYGAIMLTAIAIQSILNSLFSFLQTQVLFVDISSLSAFTIFTAMFVGYDNFCWCWKIGRIRLSTVPDFTGEWLGYIYERKEYAAHDDVFVERVQELIAVNLYVRQTFRQISVRLRSIPNHSSKSRESECTTAGLFIQDYERPKLTYTWIRSDLAGSGEFLRKSEDTRAILEGHYQSNYPRLGLIKLTRKEDGEIWHCGKLTIIQSPYGRPYLGVHIPEDFVLPCLNEMKKALSENNFEKYRQNQNIRDDGGFHMTVLEPSEYLAHRDKLQDHIDETSVWIRLIGLGEQSRQHEHVYYCVLQCEGAELLRNRAGLGIKDMHVTLGFLSNDLHEVPKGLSTLIRRI